MSVTSSFRRPAVLAVVLSLVLLTGCGSASQEPAAGTAAPTGPVVETRGLLFVPAVLTIKVGETVTWRNVDGIPHTVTSGTYEVGAGGARTSESPDGRFDYRLAGVGGTVSYTFTEPGTYTYYCKPHQAMNASIVVEP